MVLDESRERAARIQADRQLADLARAYTAAMHASRDAPDEWAALAAVNRTYYDLMRACGYFE